MSNNFRKKLFDPAPEPDYGPLPDLDHVRPGGFDWRRPNNADDDAR